MKDFGDQAPPTDLEPVLAHPQRSTRCIGHLLWQRHNAIKHWVSMMPGVPGDTLIQCTITDNTLQYLCSWRLMPQSCRGALVPVSVPAACTYIRKHVHFYRNMWMNTQY